MQAGKAERNTAAAVQKPGQPIAAHRFEGKHRDPQSEAQSQHSGSEQRFTAIKHDANPSAAMAIDGTAAQRTG